MRTMIIRRQAGEQTPVARARSSVFEGPRSSQQTSNPDDFSRKLEGLVLDVDKNLGSIVSRQETLQDEVKVFTTQYTQVGELFILCDCIFSNMGFAESN